MADEITNKTVTDTANAAENNGGDPTQPVSSQQSEKGVSTSAPEQTAKTFTQEELDAIVKQRLDRAKKDMPDKEQLKAFKAWQDSRKTAEQLAAEKISAAESGRAEAEKRLAAAEAKNIAYSKGVTAEAVEDVIALAMAKVSDDTDIGKAIDAVVAKYPTFCGGKTAEKPKITTGTAFGSGGNTEVSGVEAAFLAKNPGIKI